MNDARSTTGETQAEVIADLRSRIRERWEGFSPAARAVCRSLAERSAEELLFLSAVELGAEAKTSNATVVRTVQALGYTGLAELKARIAAPFTRSNRPELRARKRVESSGGDLENLWQRVLAESMDRIELLQPTFALDRYQQAVQLLLDANNTLTYGFGASFVAADHLTLILRRVGLRSSTLQAGGFRLADDLLGIGSGDVVVLFAPGRSVVEVETLVDQARTVGASTVLITDDPASKLAEQVTVTLQSPTTPTGLTGEPLTSIIVADVLAQGVAAANVEQSVEASERLTALRHRLGF
ncbi:MurR/RpiR family transcriptional regulator [Kribbella sp. NPDC026596]|uniref:MurR/RpiR family transcriptional regulator n=1 Tax=Kribbella sp. NPDC026596 TaxID=3155122 RepID=UPI0033D50807